MFLHFLLIILFFFFIGGFICAYLLNLIGFPAMLIVGREPERVSLTRFNIGFLLAIVIQFLLGAIYSALVFGYIRQMLSLRSPNNFATVFFFIVGIIASIAPFFINVCYGGYLGKNYPDRVKSYNWYFNTSV